MVDFKFEIKSLFPQRVIKISSDLLPQTFYGNNFQIADARYKIGEVIDILGKLSASSQNLTKPITTQDKLRQFEDQKVYLLADTQAGPKGVAIGLLKVGKKDLYVFNEDGELRQARGSPCILDFYIHDRYQRAGLGRYLFDTMLAEEQWQPVKCSIDRPSEKMIGFMKKHYGLDRVIPQSNKFVLFEGYFDNNQREEKETTRNVVQPCSIQYVARKAPNNHIQTQLPQMAVVTRYETHQPVCSMAEIMERFGSSGK